MLGELWNHACPPYPPLFAAEEYDYFRKRQSKAVKLPNPARFRKLHLKTDIAIAKSQELNISEVLAFKISRVTAFSAQTMLGPL